MKKTISIFIACSLLIYFGTDCSAFANETSGRIIRELVEGVDKELNSLESQVEKFTQNTEELKHQLLKKDSEHGKVTDELEKENIGAEILYILAKLNDEDQKEIKAYKGTIGILIPKLEQLEKEMKKIGNMGFKHKDAYIKFRSQMGKMIHNSVRIVENLRKVKDKNLEKNLFSFERTLIGIYQTFTSPLGSGSISNTQIKQSIRNMENTYAQLKNIQKQLEIERVGLKTDNLIQISRLVDWRLSQGRFYIALGKKPVKMADGIQYRSRVRRKVSKIDTKTLSGSSMSMIHSTSESKMLEEMKTKNILVQ